MTDQPRNRLASATSPYLLQHKDNPVHWWEWGDEAFAEARRRDVPVLLSVGYAACHWCHVMAHESFEDDATAAMMNEHFVNIKVDREERPDVDAVYMAATQALTGHGGWPMTVFLTQSGTPFYAGTYFPPTPRHQMASFGQVLGAVHETWTQRRVEVEDAGRRIADVLAQQVIPAPSDGAAPDAAVLAAAAHDLLSSHDTVHGGFGPAPKFPPSMCLEFLLRHVARRRLGGQGDGGSDGGSGGGPDPAFEQAALAAAGHTLHAMARSGMYDQLAGGFARYAVDTAWVVPHFEKMLYDNALLARVYLHWWRLTGEPTGARVAEETCDWMLAALGTPQGALASSLDADTPIRGTDGRTHGVEGYTYVWTPGQLRELLGLEDGEWAGALLRVTLRGTFERGTSTLQLDRDVWAEPDQAERWKLLRTKLLQARVARPQPDRDDKVVAAWNGLAIAALAECGALLGRPDLIAAAQSAVDLVLSTHLVDGRLRRVSRDGVAGLPMGVLEDYADLAEGLIALHAATGDAVHLDTAGTLLEVALEQFSDPAGGFFDTAADATDAALSAVRRPKDPTDSAYPSGNSAIAGALLSYAALTGVQSYREAALGALAVVRAGAGAPRAFGWGLAVAEAALDGPREVAVVGEGAPRATLHAVALAGTAPGLVVSVGSPDAPGVPLLTGRPVPDGAAAAAFVCRDFVCQAPTSEPAALARLVGAAVPPTVNDPGGVVESE
jgi:uncharacterized protein YyaL (SSP411 family)